MGSSLNPANSWDRAYNYDHVGRLSEALSGPEARGEALPAPPASPNSPYKQVNYYDAWGNLIGRSYRFWRVSSGIGGVYSNNRNQSSPWNYDAAGNELIEPATINSYDVTDRNVLSKSNLYIVGGGQTGHPQLPAFEIAQSYDGNMTPAKRIETRRTEEFIDGGPLTEISTLVTTTYYVSSSALGGQVVLEIESTGSFNVNKSYVYASNKRIAEYSVPSDGAPPYIIWRHSNPMTGTLLKSSESGFVNDRTELDPFGAVAGNSDPYFSDPDPTYFDLMGQKPLYIEGGDPFNMTSPCSIDGIPVTCDVVKNSWGTGNEEAMAVVPDGETRRFRNGQWEYFRAFADGRQGYLPNGAVENHEGGWHDPYSRKEGRLGTGFGPAFGFQAQQQQKKREVLIGKKKNPSTTTPSCLVTLGSRGLNYIGLQGVFHHMFITTQMGSGSGIIPTVFQGTHEGKYLRVRTGFFKAGNEDYNQSRNPGAIFVDVEVPGTCDEINDSFTATMNKINDANVNYEIPIDYTGWYPPAPTFMWDPFPDNSNAAAYTLLERWSPEWRGILEERYAKRSEKPFGTFTPGWGIPLVK